MAQVDSAQGQGGDAAKAKAVDRYRERIETLGAPAAVYALLVGQKRQRDEFRRVLHAMTRASDVTDKERQAAEALLDVAAWGFIPDTMHEIQEAVAAILLKLAPREHTRLPFQAEDKTPAEGPPLQEVAEEMGKA